MPGYARLSLVEFRAPEKAESSHLETGFGFLRAVKRWEVLWRPSSGQLRWPATSCTLGLVGAIGDETFRLGALMCCAWVPATWIRLGQHGSCCAWAVVAEETWYGVDAAGSGEDRCGIVLCFASSVRLTDNAYF